ncbi:hypothetical protein [Dethiosulfatarculus sandiegensis]|nr:hypothetical protein [Dethiosulfatarculus sandiegensis]
MGIWNLIKIAVIAFLIWTLYKGVKNWLSGGDGDRRKNRKRTKPDEVIDVMVQDPHCGTYLPMNEAIHVRSRGEDLYFCSKECRDAYLISARENGKD